MSNFQFFILCSSFFILKNINFVTSLQLMNPQRYIEPTRKLAVNMIDKSKKIAIVGSTGYIGKFVVKESTRRGYETFAFVRSSSSSNAPKDNALKDAKLIVGDVTNESELKSLFMDVKPDIVISCLASRSGTKKDSYLIDYEATLNSLKAAKDAGASQFILLSAFCVQKPLLQFQQAKLKFEDELIRSGMKYSIVRPTAFFKSVSGQLELLQQNWPFVMFDDGKICKCNPIAESDLASYILDCIDDSNKWNRILNIGGPDEGLTMKEQADMIFKIVDKEPKFFAAPIQLFDIIIGFLAFLGKFAESFEDAAELGRIGKYYAVEDMLTTKPEEKYGKITLKQHYERIAVEGQEYDPYTTFLGKKQS